MIDGLDRESKRAGLAGVINGQHSQAVELTRFLMPSGAVSLVGVAVGGSVLVAGIAIVAAGSRG